MNSIAFAVIVLVVLGLAGGIILVLASKFMAVYEDPRIAQITECLAGANCGGCGYAGCGAYAEAVLKGEAPIGKCASGGNEAAQAMAAIMGVKAEAVTRKVALVRCSGEKIYDADGNLTKGAKIKGNYEGLKDCLAASKIGGNGPVSCKFGCLGYGTCVKACKYGAMKVVNGVAHVDEDLCVGCMACASVCPRHLIVPVEPDRNVVIACASLALSPPGAALWAASAAACARRSAPRTPLPWKRILPASITPSATTAACAPRSAPRSLSGTPTWRTSASRSLLFRRNPPTIARQTSAEVCCKLYGKGRSRADGCGADPLF